MSELLPCPFCGGDADYLPDRLMADDADPPVFCNGCHASALDAAAWNRRAPSAAYAAGAEAMRERVELLIEGTPSPGEADDTETGHRYATGYRDASNAAQHELNQLLAAIRALPLPEEPTP